ncbi:MAG TPA: amino acid ABC transporter ATP-binding protein [Acidobacteriota bacterium]|jgi:ABC-type polar amino acid transport system ATPase subunit|nr:amino acid ABC transporter ATP-binding protein [Acidobacteriota bacterium]
MIEVRGLVKTAGDHRILDGLDILVPEGQTVAVVGPSGAGKSTFLRCLNGLENFQAGVVRIAGHELLPQDISQGKHANGNRSAVLRAIRLRVGMVFQSFNLFPHLTVLENLCLAPRKVLGKSRADAEAMALQLLQEVNLKGMQTRYPRQLSGGEQQRVAIARALAMQPQAMLFDEPTSNLDPELVMEVVEVIERLARQKYTMLLVTHQMGVAKRVASRVLFLDQGRIIEDSSAVQFFKSPQSERAREFLRNIMI